MLAMPDPDTFEVHPVGRAEAPEARVFCDIHNLDGTPFDGDPRQVLRRNMQAAHELGLHVLRRARHRVLLLRAARAGPGAASRSTTTASSTSTTPDATGDLRKQTIRKLEQLGHPGRVLVPRGQRRASRRSTCATPTR